MYQDLLNEIFQENSNDITLSLTLSQQEAQIGVLRAITFQSNTSCPECQSQGLTSGFFMPKTCRTCSGQGVVSCQREMQVRIPSGIRTGERLHFRGEGLLGMWGKDRGDLYLAIAVQTPQPLHHPIGVQPPSVQPTDVLQSVSGWGKTSLLNTQLGQYHLLRMLGTGGFADVYLGQHRYLHTFAAIKVMKEQVNGQNTQDFIREAQTIASLKHSNIIRILDFGVERATPYLIMDYAQNGTLRHRHPEGTQLPIDVALPYVRQIASALQYAHDQKVIHRDIKPANMLVEGNTIILSDFGIAVDVHRTQSLKLQEAVGTVSYMAPEQISGRPRPASDQYSLAVVVYEWLCGECPFNGNTAMEIAMRHINTPPPHPRSKIPTIKPAVEQVLLKALAKDPSQRFRTVLDFACELENAF